MTGGILEFRPKLRQSTEDLVDLRGYLAQLAGEPFRFARISYGDELTLHFGDLRPARSPKLNKPYGAYILGLRASAWVIKSGADSSAVIAGLDLEGLGKPVSKEKFERNPTIQPDSRVIAVSPFIVKPVNVFAAQVRFSDGSALLVMPAPPTVNEPDDRSLPMLADWELLSPSGLLSVGPSLQWTFKPTTGESKTVMHG